MKGVLIVAVIVLALAVAFGIYFTNRVDLSPIQQEPELQQSPIDPFASSQLHWDHMPLTYNSDSCQGTFEGKISSDIDKALAFIEARTGVVSFEKTSGKADITYICDIGAVESRRARGQELGFITEAEAVPFTFQDNRFAPSQIYIYATYPCLGKDRPVTVIHETLHLLGLDHNVNPSYSDDIMQPYVSQRCDLDMREEDIDYLRDIYSG